MITIFAHRGARLLSGYRVVLAVPGLRPTIAAALVGRLPMGFGSLATLLLVRHASGSFAVAGAASGAELAATAVSAPVVGRFVDRYGQRRVVVPCSLWNAAALAGLAIAGAGGAPSGILVVSAALAGLAPPPLSACMRAIYAAELDGGDLQAAYALEAILIEVQFLAGPLLVAALVGLASPAAAVAAGAVLTLIGGSWFAATPASRRRRGSGRRAVRGIGALEAPSVRLLVVLATALAFAFGAVEVATTAFARHQGAAGVAGVLLALWALGSMTGGLVSGARPSTRAPQRRLAELVAVLAVLIGLLGLAPSTAAMAPLIFLAGLPLAPSTACLFTLLGTGAPRNKVTEAFTWLNTALLTGIGAGAAIAGLVVEGAGIGLTYLMAAAAAAAAAAGWALGRGQVGPAGPAGGERLSPGRARDVR